MMTTLREYTGQLIGGPDDGNLVTASVEEIPTESTIALQLDGPGGTTDLIITKGFYKWDESIGHFKWKLLGSKVSQ